MILTILSANPISAMSNTKNRLPKANNNKFLLNKTNYFYFFLKDILFDAMKNRIEMPIKILLTKFNFLKLTRIQKETGKSINFLINILVLNLDEKEIIKKIVEGEFF